jgi:hypothetical protein
MAIWPMGWVKGSFTITFGGKGATTILSIWDKQLGKNKFSNIDRT